MTARALWQDDPLVLPVLDGDATADLCVVGLGGSGLAAVTEALDRGLEVVGLDAATVAAGAAGRNGGFLLAGPAWFHHDARERFGVDLAVALYRHTLDALDRLAAEDSSVRRTGSLRIAHDADEAADIAGHLQALRDDGLPGAPYRGPEGEGLRLPTDAVFDPHAACVRAARAALDRGARLFGHTACTGLAEGAVVTPRGTVRARRVLVCVDGGLERLVPASGVTTWRLQMCGTAPLPRRLSDHAVYRRMGLDYWQHLPDGRLVLGGGRDVGGEAERTDRAEPSGVVQAHLDGILAALGVQAPVTHRWAGTVGYTDDGLPAVHEVHPGVWAAGGYCGTGNVIGRIIGRDLVARLDGDPAPFLDLLARARAYSA